ncbi:MFS transporter [Pseudonocardia sp. RS11V-5]|uniref:MFS transporter n=1 Tax=Pseudonocardia terrae TaxID=2905831 RepID=UPI001E4F2A6A|nr:MFS transporter [Pseudonocardia terrae]MCE3551874.1 MFS transporter [Pseudonocardia terrae]
MAVGDPRGAAHTPDGASAGPIAPARGEHHLIADGQALEIAGEAAAEERLAPARFGPLRGSLLLAVGVVLAAVNLRAAVTSASSLLGDVRTGLGASAAWTSLLTTAPTLCFALAGLAAPVLARRVGLARAIGVALAVLGVGLVVRVLGGAGVMLGGTFVACAGIAVANVLVPVVVKESFAHRVGLMTGLYTAALQGSGALGSALTPPLEGPAGGWRGALVLWAALALVALVVWIVGARHRPAPQVRRTARHASWGRLLRSPVAWSVTAFMGLQSFMAYVVMGWLPQIYLGAGLSKGTAGVMLSIATLVAVPFSLMVPAIAARRRSQSGWNAGITLLAIAGALGLMLAPAQVPWLWAVLLGTGMTVFAMAMTVITLRAGDAETAAGLSAMAQGFGYLIASTGPMLVGLLHEATGGWTVSLAVLLVALVAQLVAGVLAGRPRTV